MKQKFRNTVWLILLLILSFPVGFAYSMVYNKMTFCYELIITLITSGIAMIIVFGLISLLIRFILRRRKLRDPSTIALLVYNGLLFIFAAMGAYGFQEAVLQKCGGPLW